jgi:DNA primase
MKKDGCDFREALRALAERAGVALDQRRDPQEDTRRARLYEMNEAAAAHFQAALQGPDAGAQVARSYLAERRLAPKSIEAFQLGYAPNSWESLTAQLERRGFSRDELVQSGLAVEGERGAYDRFRHRLMFPIRDDRGRIAGFGGRLLPGEALGAGDVQPKYVNTSQSPIFDKGAILYGLDLAKEAIRTEGRAVIVEGYMDVIAAHEHGFANVVASMGTSLTERQVALLKRQSSSLVLALDADNAGSEATLRSVYEIVNNNVTRRPVPNSRGIVRQEETPDLDLRVLSMPAGHDPDEVIRDDPDRWTELVDGAQPLLEYVFETSAARHDLTSPQGRAALAKNLGQWISITADRIVQANYLQRLARLTQVDEATLRTEVRASSARGSARAVPPPAPRQQPRRGDPEEFCLALLFRYPVARADGVALQSDLFGHSENRALFETWVGWADGEPFGESLTPDLRPQYERIISLGLPAYDDDTVIRALHDTVQRIEHGRLRTAKRASTAVIAEIGALGGDHIAERARDAWHAGVDIDDSGSVEADPAAVFVDDMNVGLKVHQRSREQPNAERPAR